MWHSFIFQDHFECSLCGCVSKYFVSLHDIVQRKPVRHELSRLQLTRGQELEQHWCRAGVHKPRRERYIAVPQFLHVEFHGLAVYSDVCDSASGSDHGLADIERRRNADRLDC